MDYYYPNNNKIDQICDNIWLGDCTEAANLKLLQSTGITQIFVAASEQKEHFPQNFKYKKVKLENYSWGADLSELFDESVEFMKQGNTFIHCLAGVHRAPTFTIAYLIKAKGMSFTDAYQLCKTKRPRIDPPQRFIQQLIAYEELQKKLKDKEQPQDQQQQ